MNNKVIINPLIIIKYNFKHAFTYKLLYHIMIYYDTELNRVHIDKNELILKYVISDKTVKVSIKELIDNEIIEPYNYYKNWYSVNRKVFIKFLN